MNKMPITTTVPRELEYPEIPFDKYLVYLSLSPVFLPDTIEGFMSLRLVPYRILPSGVIDKLEDDAYEESITRVWEKASTDPIFAKAMSMLMSMIARRIGSKCIMHHKCAVTLCRWIAVPQLSVNLLLRRYPSRLVWSRCFI